MMTELTPSKIKQFLDTCPKSSGVRFTLLQKEVSAKYKPEAKRNNYHNCKESEQFAEIVKAKNGR